MAENSENKRKRKDLGEKERKKRRDAGVLRHPDGKGTSGSSSVGEDFPAFCQRLVEQAKSQNEYVLARDILDPKRSTHPKTVTHKGANKRIRGKRAVDDFSYDCGLGAAGTPHELDLVASLIGQPRGMTFTKENCVENGELHHEFLRRMPKSFSVGRSLAECSEAVREMHQDLCDYFSGPKTGDKGASQVDVHSPARNSAFFDLDHYISDERDETADINDWGDQDWEVD